MYKRLLTFLITLSSYGVFMAQSVSGIVSDSETKEPIPFVTVALKNTTSGAQTDLEGYYSVLAKAGDILVFSCIGYNTQEIALKNMATLDIALVSTATDMKELVVVGYGTQKKSQVTGAIASITNKDLKDQPVANLAGAMAGRVSGVNVFTPSGTPGAGLLVSVRGNANPLYVVDGVPLVSESNSALSTAFDLEGTNTGSGQTVSSISDINPNDIERIEVLKDASATAIYGARAANGVVLITTKRGKEGVTRFNFNYYTGIQKVAREIPFMNSRQFVDLVNEARANDLAKYNADNTYFGDDFDPAVLTEPMIGFDANSTTNTNWVQAVTRTAPISNYELSANGGTDKTRFFISAGYFDQQGIVIESWYRRANMRVNLDHQATKRLSFGTTINMSRTVNRRSFNDNTYTGIITNALGASPLMPVYEADGSYASYENYQAYWLSDNPVKSAYEIRAFTRSLRALTTVFAEYKFTDALRFRTSFTADVTSMRDDQFKSALTTDAQTVGGIGYEGYFNNLTWLNENILTYTKTIGGNNLNLLAGFTAQNSASRTASIQGQGFPSGPLTNVSSAATITGVSSNGSSFAILSYIGRVNYDIKDRYLLTATMRADASSRFSKNNRTGYFPSVALGWRISQESFMANQNTVNDLKLRLSYGLTGDQEIGDFKNVTFYAPVGYNGASGIMLSSLADPNLSWQNNRMFNAGLDFELLKGRLNGSMEYFDGTKTRILSSDVIAGTTGFNTIVRNSGEIANKGIELMLGYNILDNSRIKWNISANATYVENIVTKLSSDNVLLSTYSDLSSTHILKIGQPIGTFWGIKYLGVDTQTGDAMYEDFNGDGNIDTDDSQPLGQALPKYFGGLNNVFKIRDFDVSIFTNFAAGHKVYNLIRSTYDNLGWSNDGGAYTVYANNSTYVQDRWKNPGDQAEYPRATFVFNQFEQNSSVFIEDASFVRLQQLAVGYTFRNDSRLNGTRVYLQGNNLYVLSKYKGFDPEVSSNGASTDRTAGVDYGAYPKARTILIGVNIAF